MHKIYLIFSLLFSSSILTIAQSTSSLNEKQSDKNLIIFPDLALQQIENNEILLSDKIEQKKESILEIKKDNLNSKIEEDKLKMAGYLMKKGGEQIMIGGIVSAISIGLGLLISAAGASSNRNSSSSDGAGFQLIGGTIITGGVIAGSVLRISGGSNIRKAGKILIGETLF